MRVFVLVAVALVGCASPLPAERVERDRAILAAIEPCKKDYGHFVYIWSVTPAGGVSFGITTT